MDLVLVSEREGSAWEDCVWATGVMLGNVFVGENRYPATRTEYEGLRFAATGVREAEGDGSNYGELERGLAIRYGITPIRRGSGWAGLLDNVPVGSYAGVQGWTGALPSRLQISRPVGHSLVVERVASTQFEVYDPLYVAGSGPRRASDDEIRRFYQALGGSQWIAAAEGEGWRQPMIRLNFERWQLRATADRPVPVYENPGSPRPVTNITKDTIVTTIGVPLDHSPDGVDYSYRAVIVNTAALDKIGNRKIGFIRRPAGDPMPTEAAWDAAIMKALFDPSFRGGEVIDATEAQIAAAKKEGALSALASADAAIENLKGGL